MFKTAASKLAHNTTLPVLGGNQDLKPLQDLITAEKTVLISLQKLSTDYSKAAEALRTWGQAEGDDLGDILNASTALLTQFSSALSQYAAHGHAIREHLKAVRSREEALDELKRRRRTVHRKADDAERKLNKMGPEHKNIDTQTELLYRLQDEIRTLDSEIMTEEAQLGDFKRACARRWLGLKFGGLLECSEKGIIVGEYGNLLVGEIPEDITQPGMPRSLYYGHSKINSLVNEAVQCVDQVSLSTTPSDTRKGPPLPLPPKHGSLDSPVGGTPYNLKSLDIPPLSTGGYAASVHTLPTPLKHLALETPHSAPLVDDFGMRPDTNGGKFATFPIKMRQDPPFSNQVPPSLHTRHELGDSFSLSIAEALDAKKETIGEDQPWHGRLSGEGSKLPPPSSTAPPLGGTHDSNNPWATPPAQHQTLSVQQRPVSIISEDDDALLAYMTSAEAETSSTSDHDHLGPRDARRERKSGTDTTDSRSVSITVDAEDDNTSDGMVRPPISRVPPPRVDAEKDERALNLAAARELSREIDLAEFTPPKIPSLSPQEDHTTYEQEQEGRGRIPTIVAESGQLSNHELSPLIPPAAPFAQRAVSPNPFGEPPRTAAQAYANSYQVSAGSGAQVTSNPYDYSQDPYGQSPPSSSLPPRLQGYQPAESQMVPPRLQGLRTGSSPVPPRFQNVHIANQNSPPVPYTDNSSQENRYPALVGNNVPAEQSRSSIETPYRTPPEHPAATTPGSSPRLGNSVPPQSMSSSPSGNVPGGGKYAPLPRQQQAGSPSLSSATPASLIPAGTRTISAAAFKRPQPLPSSSMDGGNFPLDHARRTHPQQSNNYVNAPPAQVPAQQQQQQPQYGEGYQHPNNGQSQNPNRMSRDLPPPPPGAAAPRPESEYDYQFDYISAYQHGDQDRGQSAEYTQQQQPPPPQQAQGQVGGGGPYYGGGVVASGQGYPMQQQQQQVQGYGQMGYPQGQQPHPQAGGAPGYAQVGGYATGQYATDMDRNGGLR